MCEPVTLGLLASAGTMGAWGTGLIGAATTAGVAGATATAAAMTATQALSLAATLGGTAMSAGAMYQQSQVAQATAKNNAKLAETQAQDAINRGEKEAIAVQQKASAVKSAQQVSLAAKGLDLSYGTAADLQDQTDFFGQSDVATTRTNARKEAWARQSQATNFQAEALSQTPAAAAGSTLLSGAGQVADRWYRYGTPRAGLEV